MWLGRNKLSVKYSQMILIVKLQLSSGTGITLVSKKINTSNPNVLQLIHHKLIGGCMLLRLKYYRLCAT